MSPNTCCAFRKAVNFGYDQTRSSRRLRACAAGTTSEIFISSSGFAYGKRHEQHVHGAEDRCRSANPDRECEHGDGGEGGAAAQATRGVTKIVRGIVEKVLQAHASLPKLGG